MLLLMLMLMLMFMLLLYLWPSYEKKFIFPTFYKKNTPKGKKEGQVEKKTSHGSDSKPTYYAPLYLNIRTSDGVYN